MPDPLRIGIIDSGVSPSHANQTVAACGFQLQDKQLLQTEAQLDKLGHAEAITTAITHNYPDAELLAAQVFFDHLGSTTLQISAALQWLVDEGAQIINMSLGLPKDSRLLGEACEIASDQGVLLVASAPASGNAVYPAACPNVWSITGDARCEKDEFSYFGNAQADFAASVLDQHGRRVGASISSAYMTGHIARCIQQNPNISDDSLKHRLIASAKYRGEQTREPLRENSA